MFDNKDIKKALDFHFRATFYSQNAIDLLDDKVVLSNIERIQKIQSSIAGADIQSEDATSIIEEIRVSYNLGLAAEDVDVPTRALRAVCFCVPTRDFSFASYILKIIEHNWVSIFTRGLIHSLLRDWTIFELDIRTSLIALLDKYIKKAGSDKYISLLPYLTINGGYQLGYSIVNSRKDIYTCCDTFRISRNRITYTYFSDVLTGYFEHSKDCDIKHIEKILSLHNNSYTDKRVISRLLVNAWKKKNIPAELYDLAVKRIGDPSIGSKWVAPEYATREERSLIEEAKRIMHIALSSKFIHVFFNSLCQDSSRLKFWLEHVDYIEDFMVYGSEVSRSSISYKLDPRILNRHFKVVASRNENCALVLFTTDYALVEFSLTGALYAYKKDSELYKLTLKQRIEKVDDLKLGFLGNLVDTDDGRMYMNEEGRMVHSGNWPYRLDRWFRKMIKK